ncbi:hypothetical protein [Paenibacillus xylanexedens]|uniref:hypothetical protein n=1 Tax=Paenibacillus xylanexedens TaxID=528191 RepID=UPI00164296CA|nr:hypothetical protein [Paenibacillus xylanexedens]
MSGRMTSPRTDSEHSRVDLLTVAGLRRTCVTRRAEYLLDPGEFDNPDHQKNLNG